jgi:hypothetical protein
MLNLKEDYSHLGYNWAPLGYNYSYRSSNLLSRIRQVKPLRRLSLFAQLPSKDSFKGRMNKRIRWTHLNTKSVAE